MSSAEHETSDAVLRVEGVHKSFPSGFLGRSRAVLRGIDLSLARGECLGLVGPNGSGKSTLLRIVAGVERPSRGRVALLGGTPADAAVRRRVGYLPEDSPFPGELTAPAALELLGSLVSMRRGELAYRATALLEGVGLAPHRRVPLARYSRGMLRRFGLAQAFLHEPELVVLDEPTAGLDAEGYQVVEELLAEARQRGASVIISSHLPADLVDYCDRLAVLVDGTIRLAGRPQELALAEGRIQLELAGADRDALLLLERALEGNAARIVALRPSQAFLLELYRRLGNAAGAPPEAGP